MKRIREIAVKPPSRYVVAHAVAFVLLGLWMWRDWNHVKQTGVWLPYAISLAVYLVGLGVMMLTVLRRQP